MLIFASRAPQPDLAYWPGRRMLASLDALAWPIAVVYLIASAPAAAGIAGACITAAACLLAVRRLYLAFLRNHRYGFTTWKWARRFTVVLAVGAVLKTLV